MKALVINEKCVDTNDILTDILSDILSFTSLFSTGTVRMRV